MGESHAEFVDAYSTANDILTGYTLTFGGPGQEMADKIINGLSEAHLRDVLMCMAGIASSAVHVVARGKGAPLEKVLTAIRGIEAAKPKREEA